MQLCVSQERLGRTVPVGRGNRANDLEFAQQGDTQRLEDRGVGRGFDISEKEGILQGKLLVRRNVQCQETLYPPPGFMRL